MRQRLIDVWAGVEQSIIDHATDPRRRRLHACIRAQEVVMNIHYIRSETFMSEK